MEALDSLVEQRPDLVGLLLRDGTQAGEQPERGDAHARRVVVEQRRLCALVGLLDEVGVRGGDEAERVERLPARLGLGTEERVHERLGHGLDLGLDRVRVLLGHLGQGVRGLLADAAVGAGEFLAQAVDQRHLARAKATLGSCLLVCHLMSSFSSRPVARRRHRPNCQSSCVRATRGPAWVPWPLRAQASGPVRAAPARGPTRRSRPPRPCRFGGRCGSG